MPWSRLFIDVLQIVPDDVGLLEEQSHVVGQVIVQFAVLQLTGSEQLQRPCAVTLHYADAQILQDAQALACLQIKLHLCTTR